MTFPNQLTDQKRWCHDSWYEATCKNQETRVKTDIAGSWSFSSRQELFLQTFSSFFVINQTFWDSASNIIHKLYETANNGVFLFLYHVLWWVFYNSNNYHENEFWQKPCQYCQQLLLSGTINQSKHTEELKQSLSSGTILRVRSR